MSLRRAAATAAVALAIGVGVAVAPLRPGVVRADPPDAAGWWSRTQVGPLLPVRQPSIVPEGGLYVAGEPTGPIAVSAVRFQAPPGSTVTGDLVLTFDVPPQGIPRVEACVTNAPWGPEQGGRLESAPAPACGEARADARVDGSVLRVPVVNLVRDSVLNVVLRPVPGSAFQATFKRPGPEALTVTATPAAADGDSADGAFDDAAPFPDPTVGAPTLSFDEQPLTSPPFEASTAPPTTVAPAAPAPPPTGSALTPVGRPTRPGGIERARFLAALIAFDLALLYLWLLRSPARRPRLLGPFGAFGRTATAGGAFVSPGDGRRGIGRFARPRGTPPIRL